MPSPEPVTDGDAAKTPPKTTDGDAMTPAKVTDDKGLASPTASFWDDYLTFSEKYDKARMGTWDDRIGVLLLFATVFAAVLTPFLVPVSALLSPDPSAGTNARLDQIILLLQNSTAKETPTDTSPFVPRASIVAVNVLWFASLGLSLFAALFSILAKQWLRAYAPSTSGTPHERARSQQQLITAFDAWHIAAVIEAMPVVLHLSLVLFLTGLVVYLWTLNHIVAGVATVIIGVTFLAYAVVFFLPLFSVTCPYYNPVLRQRKKPSNESSTDSETPKSGSSPDRLDLQSMTWLLRESTNPEDHFSAIYALADVSVSNLYDWLSSADISLVLSRLGEAWHWLKQYHQTNNDGKESESFLSQHKALFRTLMMTLHTPNARPLPKLQLAHWHNVGSDVLDYIMYSNCTVPVERSAKPAAIAALSLYFAHHDFSEKSASALAEVGHLGEDMLSWSERYYSFSVPSQVLLMDSATLFFLGLRPLSGGPNEAGWCKGLLALIFHALKESEGAIKATPEGEELRLAAANALFCALFDVSKTKYEVHFRFTSASANCFLIPSYCHLLDPQNGWRAWTVENLDALSTITTTFRQWVTPWEYNTTLGSVIIPYSLDKAVRLLWAALTEEDIDIHALKDTVKESLSGFWCQASDRLLEGGSISVLIESASRDMRPLVNLIRVPLNFASLEDDGAAQNVLSVLEDIYREKASSVAPAFQEAGGVELLWALEDAWNNIDLLDGRFVSWRLSRLVCVLAAHFTVLIPIATNDDRALIGSQLEGTVKAFCRGCRSLETIQDLGTVAVRDEELNDMTLLEWHIKASSEILPPLYTLTSQLVDCEKHWKWAYRGLKTLSLSVEEPFQKRWDEFRDLLAKRFGTIEDEDRDVEDGPSGAHDGPSGLEVGPNNAEAAGAPSVPEAGPSNAEGGLCDLQPEDGDGDPDPEAGPSDTYAEGGPGVL